MTESEKHVRIFCDYYAHGIWGVDEDLLPISDRLRRRLAEWNWWYDLSRNKNDLDFDVEEFSAVGLELAHAVKVELPDWTVEYLDEAASKRARHMRDTYGIEPPRCAWEYVITLDFSAPSWPGQRIAVTGSRNYRWVGVVRRFIQHLPAGVTLVTGCAPGIDSCVQEEAALRGLGLRLIPGSLTDDALIQDGPDRLVAFWDGDSRRTLMTILHARAARVPVTVIDRDGNDSPVLAALVAAEQRGAFDEWIEIRRRSWRPIDVGQDHRLLNELWSPRVVHLDIGAENPFWDRPITKAGWYTAKGKGDRASLPSGPFASREEAVDASRLAYFNIKYRLPHWGSW